MTALAHLFAGQVLKALLGTRVEIIDRISVQFVGSDSCDGYFNSGASRYRSRADRLGTCGSTCHDRAGRVSYLMSSFRGR